MAGALMHCHLAALKVASQDLRVREAPGRLCRELAKDQVSQLYPVLSEK